MSKQEMEYDVLVVGTGASGMATAITAAHRRGSRCWWSRRSRATAAPPRARAAGCGCRARSSPRSRASRSPPGAAQAYLQHETTTHFDEKRVDAFLENGPKAIDFFTKNTCVQFDMPPVFPDYHAEAPGGQPGGRSMVTRPFDGARARRRASSSSRRRCPS